MGKNTASGKTGKKKKSKDLSSKPVSENKASKVNENPFDWGGLPDRDLKKNLGCG